MTSSETTNYSWNKIKPRIPTRLPFKQLEMTKKVLILREYLLWIDFICSVPSRREGFPVATFEATESTKESF